MLRTRTVTSLYALPLTAAAIGYAISAMLGAPPGADHSCPSMAPLDACRYPPNTARWALSWTAGGLLVGVALASLTWLFLRRPHPRHPQVDPGVS